MSRTTDFIAELVRAANQVDKLAKDERRRLFERAVTTICDMRQSICPSAHDELDNVVDLQLKVAAIGIQATSAENVSAALLSTANMIRELHLLLETEHRSG